METENQGGNWITQVDLENGLKTMCVCVALNTYLLA